jgi:triosephosphate isomerase (TIM)
MLEYIILSLLIKYQYMTDAKKYIIGNWKSNKGIVETKDWIETFRKIADPGKLRAINNLEMVICPPFVSLESASKMLMEYNLPVKIGAQDISPFEEGAYTGEVSAGMLNSLVQYVLVGHSERRQYFGESDELLTKKVQMAVKNNLCPVYCVPDDKTFIPDGVVIAAYEPVWAIGTGKAETPENAGKVALSIKSRNPNLSIMYGGSVNPSNIKSILSASGISGVLPGKSSWDPKTYWEMIVNAA